jgi:hypothetical protein
MLIFIFLDSQWEDKLPWCFQASPQYNLPLISSWMQYRLIVVFLKYLNSATHSKILLPTCMLWIGPAVCTQDMNIYLVLSALTSKPIS